MYQSLSANVFIKNGYPQLFDIDFIISLNFSTAPASIAIPSNFFNSLAISPRRSIKPSLFRPVCSIVVFDLESLFLGIMFAVSTSISK